MVLQPVGGDGGAADERIGERVVAVRAVVGEQRRDLRLVVARPRSDVRVEPALDVIDGHGTIVPHTGDRFRADR